VGCERIVKYMYQTAELYVAWTLAFLNMFQLVILVLTLYVLCMMFYDNDENSTDEMGPYEEEKFNEDSKKRRNSSNWLMRVFCMAKSRSFDESDDEDAQDGEDHYNRYRERDQIYMTSYYL